jgi:hypothetical protein
LFELNQDLFGLPVTVLLLKDQPAEQAAPDQAREQDEDGVEGCQSSLVRTQEKRKKHCDETQ